MQVYKLTHSLQSDSIHIIQISNCNNTLYLLEKEGLMYEWFNVGGVRHGGVCGGLFSLWTLAGEDLGH